MSKQDGFTAPLDDVARHRFTRRSALVQAATSGAALATLSAIGLGTRSAIAQEATLSTHSHGEASATHAQEATPSAEHLAFIAGEDLKEPEVRASQNGLLETTFTVRDGPITVAGLAVTARVYEGSFPGPTLRVRSGDTVRVNVVNELTEMTNLHTHGFHVSPEDNSDNIFAMIHPGETFQYEYHLPPNHSPGLYWYHPHSHGLSDGQVSGGMAGAIINEGGLDDLPGIAGLTERLLLIQATEFGPDGVVLPPSQQAAATQLHLINGQLQPVIRIRPGETQRWRIANVHSENFYDLALTDHTFHQIAADASPFDSVQPVETVLLGPGERAEVLIQATTTPGSYALQTLAGSPDMMLAQPTIVATIVVEGEPVTVEPLPTTLIPFEDLSPLQVDNKRAITFQVFGSPEHYAIDGRAFDPEHVDQTVRLNALEEWVIHNDSDDFHPFHIHVNDFQVVAINDQPHTAHGYNDTYLLPPHGSITMRTRFLDFTGKFVYHCHILYHEDHGMMGVVEVVP